MNRVKIKKFARILFYISSAWLMAILMGCSGNKEQKADYTKYVKAIEVKSGTNNITNTFSGKVEEIKDVQLSFRVGGPINKLSVDEGDYINKGDIIAEIDERDYLINFNKAKANYSQVKSEFKRYKELYKINKICANNFEKFETAFLMAENAYKNAENALNDTKLKAPFSGYIFKKQVDNFETVSPGMPIVSIIDMSKMEISIHLSDSQLEKLERLEKANCNIQGAEVNNIPVKLKSVNKKSNGADLYEVKFILNNSNNAIRPGMAANVVIEYGNNNGRNPLLPIQSVFSKNNNSYVWIYNTTTSIVKKQKVKIGNLNNNGRIEIISGIKEGDMVISAGVHSLTDNQKVQLIKKKAKTNIGGLL